MLESDWRSDDRPDLMWRFLAGHLGQRKLRLFACAALRRSPDARLAMFADVFDVAERYADGLADDGELQRASGSVRSRWRIVAGRDESQKEGAVTNVTWPNLYGPAALGTLGSAGAAASTAGLSGADISALMREVFGNPFRPVVPDPRWLTADVTALAGTAYDSRDWDVLPVLADALEDAGCDSAALLGHLRGAGPHAAGCWALDVALGRPDAVPPAVTDAAGWADCRDVRLMLAALAGRPRSARALRTFAVVCLRDGLEVHTDPDRRGDLLTALDAVGRFADAPAGHALPAWRLHGWIANTGGLAAWVGDPAIDPLALATLAADAAASWRGYAAVEGILDEGCEWEAFAAEAEARTRYADLLRAAIPAW